MRLYRFIKDWILIFAILGGIAGYFIYASIPALDATHKAVLSAVEIVQPLLIFMMLFLTFCKVNPRRLRLCGWHWWLLAVQTGFFLALAALAVAMPTGELRVIVEGAMICFVCPVATAGVVITRKLGGNAMHITTYTILINLVVALIIPAVVPFVHPQAGISMWTASVLILGKVFPLLLLPMVVAFMLRWMSPRLHYRLTHTKDAPFYLWVVALTLAIAVTTRFIMHSDMSVVVELGLGLVALVSCLAQFAIGWKIGARYGDRITAGQSLGQKNTVLAIWMGYTFFTPITSVAGGFYSIFHNVVNSLQLYRASHKGVGRR